MEVNLLIDYDTCTVILRDVYKCPYMNLVRIDIYYAIRYSDTGFR